MAGAASGNPVKGSDLEIDEVADGYIVYQPDRDRVHYLNRTAALVLELCNGRNAEADLPELLQLAWDLPAPPVEEVAECLKLLSMEGLIDADFAAGPAVSGRSPVRILLPGLRPFLLKLQPEFDRFVSAHIRRYRVWEPLETAVVRAFLPTGGSLIDIGANLGWYTIVGALSVGGSGRIFAFEPEPTNYALLCENISLNGLANTTPVAAAAADCDGEAMLYLSDDNLGDHRLYDSEDRRRSCLVRTTSLDSYFGSNPPRIDVMKIDTQGSEARVLAGMQRTLRHSANRFVIIVAEFWPYGPARAGSSAGDLIAQLNGPGRTPLVIDENRGKLVPIDWHELGEYAAANLAQPLQSVNLLLLPSGRQLPSSLEGYLPIR
jgi:FkbM family methyltransferase